MKKNVCDLNQSPSLIMIRMVVEKSLVIDGTLARHANAKLFFTPLKITTEKKSLNQKFGFIVACVS